MEDGSTLHHDQLKVPPLLLWDRILPSGEHWAYLVACPEREIDTHTYREALGIPECVTRIVRGKRSQTPAHLFQEWAAAFQFPYYFGHNWDALYDCLTDLDWLAGKAYVAVATHIEDVLPEYPEEFQTFIYLLRKAAEEWIEKSQPVPFRVVFHCRQVNEGAAWLRLEQAGVAVEVRRVPALSTTNEPET